MDMAEINANRRLYGLAEIPDGQSVCPRCKLLLADDADAELVPLVPRWGWSQRAHVGCAWADGSPWVEPPTFRFQAR